MKNIAVALALAASFACTGAPTPETVAPATPPIAEPPPAPPPVKVGTDPTGAVKLDPALIDEIVRVRGELDTAADAQGVARAWRDARALAEKLATAIQPTFEAKDNQLDLAWLLPSLPGLGESAEAEGTMIVFYLQPEPWLAKAKTTTDPVDDRFFELVIAVYGTASTGGWAAWDERTWDYGGCSLLGKGVILDALKKADAARDAGIAFSPEIGEIRTRIWAGILEDEGEFPYCDPATSKPTPDAALQEEAKRILAEVKLTPDEKQRLEARIPKLKGANFKGG